MHDPSDRTDRFELIAACDGGALTDAANQVLATEPSVSVRQEPRPQLLMQRVRDPVENRPFNLGEVVVTPAEVELDGADGFAMRPGKAERQALSGAIVDAAVAGGHPAAEAVAARLEETRRRFEDERERERARSRHTTVAFDIAGDDL